MQLNPVLILGGGQNNYQIPTFLFSGKHHVFKEHDPDLIEEYINQKYHNCGKCLLPGVTTGSCNNCKKRLHKEREKVKADLKIKN